MLRQVYFNIYHACLIDFSQLKIKQRIPEDKSVAQNWIIFIVLLCVTFRYRVLSDLDAIPSPER